MTTLSNIPAWYEGELPFEPCARQIADSISPSGRRVTTYELRIWRAVLAELNTHTLFSRNSASSRARPLRRKTEAGRPGTLDDLEIHGPAYPIAWPFEQRGMQGADEEVDEDLVKPIWLQAMNHACEAADALAALGLHKSLANRLIEPFSFHVVTVTAENWEGFFRQRSWNHTKLVQPEFGIVATMIENIHNSTTPRLVEPGDFHTPYILDEEYAALETFDRCKISSARAARTSYLTHTGTRDWEQDLGLYAGLTTAEPPHASPLQHVATPDPANEATFTIDPAKYGIDAPTSEMTVPIVGNYRGWMQLRHIVMGF